MSRVARGAVQGTRPSLNGGPARVSTGVPSLDHLLGGGLPLGAVLLLGLCAVCARAQVIKLWPLRAPRLWPARLTRASHLLPNPSPHTPHPQRKTCRMRTRRRCCGISLPKALLLRTGWWWPRPTNRQPTSSRCVRPSSRSRQCSEYIIYMLVTSSSGAYLHDNRTYRPWHQLQRQSSQCRVHHPQTLLCVLQRRRLHRRHLNDMREVTLVSNQSRIQPAMQTRT